MEEHVQVFIKRWALRHFESLTCLYEISETNPLKEKDGEDPEGISFSAPEGAIFIFSWGSSAIPKQLYLWICDAALMKRNRSFKYIQKVPPGWDYPQTVILHRSWEKVVSKSWIEQSANLNRLCLPLDMNNMTFKTRNFEGSSTCFKGKTILHSKYTVKAQCRNIERYWA